jgi:hypothetical protein
MTTLKCIKFEINMAVLFNVVVLSIFNYNLDELYYKNYNLNYIMFFWLILHSGLNFISIFPKLILITKVRIMNIISNSIENLIENLKIFLCSRIYYFNQLLSKTILISYGIGFLLAIACYIYQGIYQGKESDLETSKIKKKEILN